MKAKARGKTRAPSRTSAEPNAVELSALPSSKPATLEVATEWLAWCAENLAEGASRAEVHAALVGEGASVAVADRTMTTVEASPIYAALRSVVRRARRARMVASLAEKNRRLAPSATSIPRIAWPGTAELVERYLATSTPVIVTDVVSRWPALERWALPVLRERFGDVEVEIATGRDADPDYDMHTRRHTVAVPLRDYVAKIEAAGTPTNDFYMVAQHRNVAKRLRALLDDVVLPPDLVRREGLENGAQFWLGPAGTVTPLHHDTSSILFCQVVGRKRFRLVAPTELRLLDDARSMYAAVDPEAPDLARFPWWPEVLVRDEVIAPGEMLVLPVGWWHHVRALDVSASLAVNALLLPNKFEDYVPGDV